MNSEDSEEENYMLCRKDLVNCMFCGKDLVNYMLYGKV